MLSRIDSSSIRQHAYHTKLSHIHVNLGFLRVLHSQTCAMTQARKCSGIVRIQGNHKIQNNLFGLTQTGVERSQPEQGNTQLLIRCGAFMASLDHGTVMSNYQACHNHWPQERGKVIQWLACGLAPRTCIQTHIPHRARREGLVAIENTIENTVASAGW